MRFRDYFTKEFESSDDNIYDSLKTRYYRSKMDEAVRALKEIITSEKANLIDENNQYNEYLFENSSYSCTAKITAITPVEMAIDFRITTFNLIGMGKGKKVIEELYRKLDTKLSFKGVGLFKG